MVTGQTPEVFYMTLGEPDLELELVRKADYDSLSDELRATQADAAMDRENARAALHRAQRLEEQYERAKEYEDQWNELASLWNELASLEFIEYWHTIGFTCSAGTAIKHLLEQVEWHKQVADENRAAYSRMFEQLEATKADRKMLLHDLQKEERRAESAESQRDTLREAGALISDERDRLLEQFDALNETLRLITEAAGDDGTAPDDWRANTDKPKTALFAVRELRKDYDEAIGVPTPASRPS